MIVKVPIHRLYPRWHSGFTEFSHLAKVPPVFGNKNPAVRMLPNFQRLFRHEKRSSFQSRTTKDSSILFCVSGRDLDNFPLHDGLSAAGCELTGQ